MANASFFLRNNVNWLAPSVYMLVGLGVFVVWPRFGQYLLWGFPVTLFFIFRSLGESVSDRVDLLLRRSAPNHAEYRYHRKQFPGYRFVDLHRALSEYTAPNRNLILHSSHFEELPDLMAGRFYDASNRNVNNAAHTGWAVGPEESEQFATETFWITGRGEIDRTAFPGHHVLRLRYDNSADAAILEVGLPRTARPQALLNGLERMALRLSIYKNQMLSVTFDPEQRDEFGTLETREKLNLEFIGLEPIAKENIVIDPALDATLQRNVYDLFEKRAVLQKHGVPLNRGLLFYGPPGTGKTYTCRHIFSRLKEVTLLVATGQALTHIKSICNLARMLEPAVVLLEDVDLVFQDRDISLYSSALGDLLDQLDGFKANDSVVFVLTTNSINRLERAIKDRPGRISQCILFEPPTTALRVRYLEFHLQDRKVTGLDLKRLAEKVPGVTQAFLKEWCVRAVQFASEDDPAEATLQEAHFDRALDEIVRHDNEAAYNIIGYRQAVL